MDDDHVTRCCFLLINAFIFLTLNSSIHSSLAADTISPGQCLSGNQTLVSKGGSFELGFFSPGNSHKYYIGIWFKNIPSKDIIWIANRQAPILNPSTSLLKLSNNGNLVLLNETRSSVWSSNSTSSTSNSMFAVLLDTGNLVIVNTSTYTKPLWQSFDHPSHTWMPGGWLGLNKLTGEFQSITSWRNSEDPSPGLYTEGIHPDGSNQFVLLYNGSLVYWSTGLWNGQFFSGVPGTKEKSAFNFSFVDNKERKYATYTLDPNVISYTLMDPSGQVKQMLWMNTSQRWFPFYNQPVALCNVYSVCGAFGVCDHKSSPICSCYVGFKPVFTKDWKLGAWSSGCTRKTILQCDNKSASSTHEDGFFEMKMVRLPSNPVKLRNAVQSNTQCEQVCRRNCSCTAYTFDDGQCSIWSGDLHNAKQLYDGDSDGDGDGNGEDKDNAGNGTLHIRLAASDIPPPTPSSTNRHLGASVIFSVVAGTLVIIFLVFMGLTWVRKSRRNSRLAKHAEGSLISFTYADLRRMTKNFSDVLGRGGFGSVFRGKLPDSTVIAVKKLEGLRQGEKQFRTEVSTLGSIQHVNLVHLHGFCCEGNKRLLAPRFWSGKVRFKIILGVAKGLAYLHEKCRECIIHCDIKPENILLDEEFSPKVADFGMAKLMGRDFSKVLTTMRGTIGYLAPEWISGLPITAKVDVYSFGMMLFELISGERNSKVSINSEDDGEENFFPFRAANLVAAGDIIELLDKRLQGEVDLEELKRVCKVACWCIQDSDALRPTMGQVVQILEGVLDVNTPPVPRSLQNLINSPNSVYYSLPLDAEKDTEDQTSLFYSLPLTEIN
ncbi:S-receptor-like serine/threonine-protein kinase protein [Dioscorea alata]|uniref:S-receptor-like serine/threonine-protein kinase protein n=1 Tax=Dioscorea alata TaxID=55571 RepID=A0ACB7UPF6_DIOAL|nr:S-receptor-like serine/threonine-protein kinase protein [Dioscorea alata]